MVFRTLLILAATLAATACDESRTVEPSAPMDAVREPIVLDPSPVISSTPSPEQMLLETIPEMDARVMTGLRNDVQVVYTELGVPHLFGSDRADLSLVLGYLMAKDRYWMMDLARRLGAGRVSELLGDLALETDIGQRNRGIHEVGKRIYAFLDPDRKAELDAMAKGVNHYIDEVRDGASPAPSELQLFYGLLGVSSPADLMDEWTGQDLAYFAAVVVDQSACELDELSRGAAVEVLQDRYPDETSPRRDGLLEDMLYGIRPITDTTTVEGAIVDEAVPESNARAEASSAGTRFNSQLFKSSAARLFGRRLLRLSVNGSNAWAVAPEGTSDDATLLAGDGHLELTSPAYFFQASMDTGVLGQDPWHVRGNFLPGIPFLGTGTNGHVAWSFTCFYADPFDYYSEVVQVDDAGRLVSTLFDGQERAVVAVEETYTIRDIGVLQSEGGVKVSTSYQTFDGRRIFSVEGRPAENGESGIEFGTGPVVPTDTDGDGIISALSIDSTHLDIQNALGAFADLSTARDLTEFGTIHRRLAVFGSHFVAADKAGNIMATGYNATPCRKNLPRRDDGLRYASGADPRMVLDGTQYGAFEVQYNADGSVDETDQAGASCMTAHADFPRAYNPSSGIVVSGNNDPAGSSLDNSLANDEHYLGGPWALGLRAERITELLRAQVDDGMANIEGMARIQADHRATLAARWLPMFLEFITVGRNAMEEDDPSNQRHKTLSEIYGPNAARFEEVYDRLARWSEDGLGTHSGVETVYNRPTDTTRANATATMIFYSWINHFIKAVIDDEELPQRAGGASEGFTDTRSIIRSMDRLLMGRGDGNPLDLVSWQSETSESILFDDIDTERTEHSTEIGLSSLAEALDQLGSEPSENDASGFGTPDMSQWLWGLRHTLNIKNILVPFIGDVGDVGDVIDSFFGAFTLTPQNLPIVADPLNEDDPRFGLAGFPRPGDNFSPDSAAFGYDTKRFSFDVGPVMRLVVALYPDGTVKGQNIIPGGQSGLSDSPHFGDQMMMWLGNDTIPLRFHLDEIVEGAEGRIVFQAP